MLGHCRPGPFVIVVVVVVVVIRESHNGLWFADSGKEIRARTVDACDGKVVIGGVGEDGSIIKGRER